MHYIILYNITLHYPPDEPLRSTHAARAEERHSLNYIILRHVQLRYIKTLMSPLPPPDEPLRGTYAARAEERHARRRRRGAPEAEEGAARTYLSTYVHAYIQIYMRTYIRTSSMLGG